ncbi:MAG: hypothetical protein IJS39_16005 [Synergistaceae bacterium]|nr:hypothetical protein [Synergistaceae bacterium]
MLHLTKLPSIFKSGSAIPIISGWNFSIRYFAPVSFQKEYPPLRSDCMT